MLTFESDLADICSVEIPFHIEKTKGEGTLPNLKLEGKPNDERIGVVRSMLSRRYNADEDSSFTRWVGVTEEYRRHGFGKMFLCRALKEMRTEGCAKTVLNVRASNPPAIRLYETTGCRLADTLNAGVKIRLT